jgi:hypothetical protein
LIVGLKIRTVNNKHVTKCCTVFLYKENCASKCARG